MSDHVSFPLLRLPIDIMNPLLRSIDLSDQISFSAISKRSKKIIRSLRIPGKVKVTLRSDDVQLMAYTGPEPPALYSFHSENGGNWEARPDGQPLMLSANGYLENKAIQTFYRSISPGPTSYVLQKPGKGLRYWLDHFQFIFNSKEISQVTFAVGEHFDTESFGETIQDLHVGNAMVYQCSNANCRKIFESLNEIKKATLMQNPYENPSYIDKIFVRRFEEFSISGGLKLTVNNMISIKSGLVIVDQECFSEENFNRFVRLWTKFPIDEIQHLVVYFHDPFSPNRENVLKGLKYEEVPIVRVRQLKNQVMSYPSRIYGGFDLKREKDGRKASVVIRENDRAPFNVIEFIVWN